MRVSDFHRAVGFEAKIEMHAPFEGRKRFRGRLDAVADDSGAPVATLTRFDAKPGDADIVYLPLADIADGRLVLTDDLIRETLRAAKAAEREASEAEADHSSREGDDPASAGRRGRGDAGQGARPFRAAQRGQAGQAQTHPAGRRARRLQGPSPRGAPALS